MIDLNSYILSKYSKSRFLNAPGIYIVFFTLAIVILLQIPINNIAKNKFLSTIFQNIIVTNRFYYADQYLRLIFFLKYNKTQQK